MNGHRKCDHGSQPGTLAEVLTTLEANEALGPARKRDLCSAVRRIAELIDRPLDCLPARLSDLKPALEKIHPARVGLSEKTWQNLRSNLKAALLAGGIPGNGHRPLDPEWRTLASLLPEKRQQDGLSRFLHHCSGNGIAPAVVGDSCIETFVAHLRERTFLTDKKIRDCHRRTCRLWNEVVERVPGWPQTRLTVPDYRAARRSWALSALPESFRADTEDHLSQLGSPFPAAKGRRGKPLKAKTIDLRRKQIELAASALVHSGWKVETLKTLADLVQPEAMKAILLHYSVQTGGEWRPRVFAHSLAQMLCSLAKNWVCVPQEHLDELRDIRRCLGAQPSGLTEKNRRTLRQFEDDENLLRLLLLPEMLLREAQEMRGRDRRAGVRAQIALALGLLLHVPLRMENLIELSFDEHITRPGGNRGPMLLAVSAGDTKNTEPLEFTVPETLQRMLELYRQHFWVAPSLSERQWLFTTRSGHHKTQNTLAQQIARSVKKRTGLTITPHQFRHLAGKIILRAQPGNTGTVQYLLGHKSQKTTNQSYIEFDTRAAGEVYDGLLDRLREKARADDKRQRKTCKPRKKPPEAA